MSDPVSPNTLQPTLNALVASGFPFQTAVSQVIRRSAYTLVAEEIPWRDDAGNDQFLDLVAEKNRLTLTIECKKTQKETLTFLRPNHSGRNTSDAHCFRFSHTQLSAGRMKLLCDRQFLTPQSPESSFCVVSTGEKDQRLIERDAQRLLRGTQAYAAHRNRPNNPIEERLFVPVLVTNAKLSVADYLTDDVSLETGQFSMPPNVEVIPKQWVRFRKSFTSSGDDFGDRTVFVVAATAFEEFLVHLDKSPQS